MNLWECDASGCDSTAVGAGGAVGLRAIGWYFAVGPTILCPSHHPDKVPCTDLPSTPTPEEQAHAGKPCSLCAAEAQAKRIQRTLMTSGEAALDELARLRELHCEEVKQRSELVVCGQCKGKGTAVYYDGSPCGGCGGTGKVPPQHDGPGAAGSGR